MYIPDAQAVVILGNLVTVGILAFQAASNQAQWRHARIEREQREADSAAALAAKVAESAAAIAGKVADAAEAIAGKVTSAECVTREHSEALATALAANTEITQSGKDVAGEALTAANGTNEKFARADERMDKFEAMVTQILASVIRPIDMTAAPITPPVPESGSKPPEPK